MRSSAQREERKRTSEKVTERGREKGVAALRAQRGRVKTAGSRERESGRESDSQTVAGKARRRTGERRVMYVRTYVRTDGRKVDDRPGGRNRTNIERRARAGVRATHDTENLRPYRPPFPPAPTFWTPFHPKPSPPHPASPSLTWSGALLSALVTSFTPFVAAVTCCQEGRRESAAALCVGHPCV
jgi:hypothetical protein